MDHFAVPLGEFLDHLIARSFELPIHFAVISVNGCITGGCYKRNPAGQGLDTEILVEHIPSGMVLPINCVLVDSRGQVGRMVIEKSGWREVEEVVKGA